MFRTLVLLLVAQIYAVYGFRGKSLDGKIVGGKAADIEDYPYQLSLEHFGQYQCGATLIRPNVAITAAHCTADMKDNEWYLRFRAGTSKIYMGGELSRAVTFCDHPKFNRSTYDYDISVVLLNTTYTLGSKIQTIPLQPAGEEIPTGLLANVTGWGYLRQNGLLSQQLQVVQVPKTDQFVCDAVYHFFGNSTTDRMSCFGFAEGGKDACQGDSGGPLVIDNKLVGIISWGHGCAWPIVPGVYTKISHPEIQQHIYDCLEKFEV